MCSSVAVYVLWFIVILSIVVRWHFTYCGSMAVYLLLRIAILLVVKNI